MHAPKPRPPWLSDLLNIGEVYEVGGSVRDRLLGLEASQQFKDTDYLVRLIPLTQLQKSLRRYGTVNVVGKSFGVVKFTPHPPEGEDPQTFDLALPRRERSTGTGHTDFAVDFDPELPVDIDLRRRDFTINAIAQSCADGALIDPTGGVADVQARRLKMVFPDAFTEDPLRILRGAQFAARFTLKVDESTEDAMRAAAHLVPSVSPERIAEEFYKLLVFAEKPSIGFRLLASLGVLEMILPELSDTIGVEQPGGFHAYNVFDHTMETIDLAPQRLRLRWACLLHDINKPQCRVVDGDKATFYNHAQMGSKTARRILRRLRYPHDLADQVATLVDRHMFTTEVTDKGLRRLMRRVGLDLLPDLLELRRADTLAHGTGMTNEDVDEFERRISEELSRQRPFDRTDLAVNGTDLMREFDLPAGPRLGRLLSELLEVVLDEPELNTREDLLAIARKSINDSGKQMTG